MVEPTHLKNMLVKLDPSPNRDEHKHMSNHHGLMIFPLQKNPTLPETNIAPENEPLEKEIPIGNHHF